MVSGGASQMGATCAIAGSVLLFIGTYLHPMSADPNQAAAAFAEYAADPLWVASHLTQLAGVALIVAALLLLAQQLRAGSAAAWAGIAAGAAIVGLAVAVALQAVDGIALKFMVDAWAAAPAAQKEGLFHAAFAVRQIEIGLASNDDVSGALLFIPTGTITTAAFFIPGLAVAGSCSPKREATAFSDWMVYSRLSSPVPGKPTTTP